MFEKVNPAHPDKMADRIAGAMVDLAYTKEKDPRIAVEVLLGHKEVSIIAETSVRLGYGEVSKIVSRIYPGSKAISYKEVKQDGILANNQLNGLRCGDNGIFKGMPVTEEQRQLAGFARNLYADFPTDGKYILDLSRRQLIICQSNMNRSQLSKDIIEDYNAVVNPLGDWSGGPDVDAGATNRKLGSDMGDSITGGGLHGKDLSKADVTLNICAWLDAQEYGRPMELYCAIGDKVINGREYSDLVERAREFIREKGGFEKFAEWGLI